ANNDAGAAVEQKALERWVTEAVKHLARAWDIHLTETAPAHLRERAGDALESCRHTVQDAYHLAGVRPPSEVIHLLTGSSDEGTDDCDPEADQVGVDDADDEARVLEHPSKERLPDPLERIPMSRGTWSYEPGGEDRRHRGVYTWLDGRWILVADLPIVHAQIIERDGSGRRTGVQWLMSAHDGEAGLIVTWEDLGTARWANMLNLRLSRDPKAKEAAATAIE